MAWKHPYNRGENSPEEQEDKAIWETLTSERSMKAVNVLFFLALLIRNRWITAAALALWGGYLLYCAKHTPDRIMKIVYRILAGIAAGAMVLNLVMEVIS